MLLIWLFCASATAGAGGVFSFAQFIIIVWEYLPGLVQLGFAQFDKKWWWNVLLEFLPVIRPFPGIHSIHVNKSFCGFVHCSIFHGIINWDTLLTSLSSSVCFYTRESNTIKESQPSLLCFMMSGGFPNLTIITAWCFGLVGLFKWLSRSFFRVSSLLTKHLTTVEWVVVVVVVLVGVPLLAAWKDLLEQLAISLLVAWTNLIW